MSAINRLHTTQKQIARSSNHKMCSLQMKNLFFTFQRFATMIYTQENGDLVIGFRCDDDVDGDYYYYYGYGDVGSDSYCHGQSLYLVVAVVHW